MLMMMACIIMACVCDSWYYYWRSYDIIVLMTNVLAIVDDGIDG
jgi:hypothetical protein